MCQQIWSCCCSNLTNWSLSLQRGGNVLSLYNITLAEDIRMVLSVHPLVHPFVSLSNFQGFCILATKLPIRLIPNLMNEFIMGLPQPWKLLVTLHWIPSISESLISQEVFMHLQTNFMGLTLHIVDELVGIPRPDQLLFMLRWIPTISWLLIGQAVSVHLQTNHTRGWISILWVNSLWDYPCLINLWSCSAELPQFPGLWFVKQFLHICSQTAAQIYIKLDEWTYYLTT